MSDLLAELMETSPIIEDHINSLAGLAYGVEEGGSKNTNDYITECIEILLGLLEDQGIVFHVDQQDILADFYSTKFLIQLYLEFNVSSLISRLHNDRKLFNNISAGLENMSDNETLVTVLESFMNHEGSQFSRDMYVYLFDKVTNTNLYSQILRANLDDLAHSFETEDLPVIDEDVNKLIRALMEERSWAIKMLGELVDLKLDFDYREATKFCERFRLEFNKDSHIAVFANRISLQRSNPDLTKSSLVKVRKGSPYYHEFYTDEELQVLPLSKLMVIILAQFSDKRLFEIEPNFDRLKTHASTDIDPILSALKSKILIRS